MAENSFVVACIQLTSGADAASNLERCARLSTVAAKRGAQLVVLPENFALLAPNESEKFAVAENLDTPGPILGAIRAIAAELDLWVVAGGFPEKTEDPTKVWNSCIVVAPDGRIAAHYRKIHLFDVSIPGGAEFQESRTVSPGDAPVVVETPWAKVGLSICYDLRFPELYRKLVAMGAQLVVVPAAFTLHTGKDHWHTLLRARAIENQVYVLAAAQVGRHNEKRETYGHSLICDPWGTIIAEAPNRETVVVGEIDLDAQVHIRRQLPCLEHRRL